MICEGFACIVHVLLHLRMVCTLWFFWNYVLPVKLLSKLIRRLWRALVWNFQPRFGQTFFSVFLFWICVVTKPEISFLPGNLRWTLAVALFGCCGDFHRSRDSASVQNLTNWEADTQCLGYSYSFLYCCNLYFEVFQKLTLKIQSKSLIAGSGYVIKFYTESY